MVPLTEIPVDNLDTQLYELIGSPPIRYQYNKTTSWIRKFQNITVNVAFLEECLDLNIIPKSFRIANQPQDKKPAKFQVKWTSASKSASIEWMKLAIEADSKLKMSHNENYKKSLKELLKITPEYLKQTVKSRMEHKSRMFNREFLQ